MPSNLSGSVTSRLPWIHLGSMALSHGLFWGNGHATIRTPWPLVLTRRLWAAIQPLTRWLSCQLALPRSSLDQYTYVWKTNKAWAGTCRQLVVKLDDGTYHRANFNFTK